MIPRREPSGSAYGEIEPEPTLRLHVKVRRPSYSAAGPAFNNGTSGPYPYRIYCCTTIKPLLQYI